MKEARGCMASFIAQWQNEVYIFLRLVAATQSTEINAANLHSIE